MINFLKELDDSIQYRYYTVERNIKSKSNSFYDSYLDLLESTIKIILNKNEINYDKSGTCGSILKEDKVASFYMNELGVNDSLYNKVLDYIKKINDHKHKNEKYVNQDVVVLYMNVYFQFIQAYQKYNKIPIKDIPDEQYYKNMFGITEQKNKDYKETFEKLEEKLDLFLEQNKLSQEEIKEYKSIVSLKDIELLNLEEQNKVLQENISKLKDIESKMGSLDMIINKLDSLDAIQNKVSSLEKKLNSSVEVSKGKHNDLERFIKTAKKEHFWLGSTAEFKKTKMRAKYFLYALFAAGVLSTIISSIAFKMYSTFTLVENIWLIFSVVLFSYLQHNQKKILDIDLANHDNTIYIKVSDGSWRSTGEEKKRFKWSRRLSHVAVLLNIVALWVISPGPLAAVATIFELLFLGLSIAANYFYSDFSDMYGAFIFFTNKLETDGKLKTLVFDGLHKKLMSFEEFNEQFGKFNK